MSALGQFNKQKYLNLESFRRSRDSMKTPLWFIQDDESLYVQSVASSGKAKHVRTDWSVKTTPRKMDGTQLTLGSRLMLGRSPVGRLQKK